MALKKLKSLIAKEGKKIPLTIEVGHEYMTRCGNVVKIVEEGKGVFNQVILGHEALMGTVHNYTKDGKWHTVYETIHDIVECVTKKGVRK